MVLSPGTRLGPYEVIAPIGAGGMGEVYKAKDTRLDRTVAVKVLPEHLAESPERKARFEREAKAISQLNHPHICTLHDVGEQDGTDYLVMEYIEGETLAERLKRGALKLDQALEYGIQIADGLDKAHRAGIVHRDLKPANVILTKSGVKLLDFGLVRLTRDDPVSDSSDAPTQQKDLTKERAIIGTLQYMAPEQLEGKEVDARTDLFAFGAVLYEMVTGRKAFEGESQASLIGAIMTSDPPPISRLQAMSPPLLDHVVQRCLAKEPDERRQSARDLFIELKWIRERALPAAGTPPLIDNPHRRERFAWAVAAFAVLGTLSLMIGTFARRDPEVLVQKFTMVLPEVVSWGSSVVSPDGQHVAFVGVDDSGERLIWVRSFSSLVPKALPGTDEGHLPFWSPDSRFIGFFTPTKLKKVVLSGAPPETLCDVPSVGRGGTWGQDGMIVFGHAGADGVLHSVSEKGGVATPLTTLDASRQENSHRWPYFLPDGRHVLYTARSASGEHSIYLTSLDSGATTRLMTAFSRMAYALPGFILFVRDQTLMAQVLELSESRLSGNPFPLADGVVHTRGTGFANFSVSRNGTLTFEVGRASGSLAWLDREGNRLNFIDFAAEEFFEPSISPDGNRLALAVVDPNLGSSDIWLHELSRGISSPLTFDPEWDETPIWSPDGKSLVFKSRREGVYNLYEVDSTGTGSEELLLKSELPNSPTDWSPTGELIMYSVEDGVNSDLWVLPLEGDRKPEPFLETPFSEVDGRFSPDEQWVAYASDRSGRYEVYVQAFRRGGTRRQISASGGRFPHWRRDGRELFYKDGGGKLMVVPIELEATLDVGAAQSLFQIDPGRTGSMGNRDWGAPSTDGQRFLAISSPEAALITVVLNWTADIE